MDKAKLQHIIEVDLIAMRYKDSIDPFVMYQNTDMSKRKLIEVIASHIAKELHEAVD